MGAPRLTRKLTFPWVARGLAVTIGTVELGVWAITARSPDASLLAFAGSLLVAGESQAMKTKEKP